METFSISLGEVQGLNNPRTPPGERRVLTHQGWAGEKSGYFSIL